MVILRIGKCRNLAAILLRLFCFLSVYIERLIYNFRRNPLQSWLSIRD